MSWATHISMLVSDSEQHSEARKTLAFADRSAAFCYHLNSLLKLAAIESLRFISELVERIDAVDLENNYSESDSLALEMDECPFNPYQKVIIPPEQIDSLIAGIDLLFLWCSHNISEARKAFSDDGWSDEDIKKAMAESAQHIFEQFDDQQSGDPDFLFCVLKSMQGLLMYAKNHNMPVIYENLAEG